MIITIKGADFSLANIGTLSTCVVTKSLGRGIVHDIPYVVEKNSSVNWVLTLDNNYTFGTYMVTMGETTITPTIDGNTMTISIPKVTNNIRISIATININTDDKITTFFTTGTKGSKRESKTINGFTWVMPTKYLTSRVNAIKVPVFIYKDEYDYIDLICEIFEPMPVGSKTVPTRKPNMVAVTRMTEDGDAIFNVSLSLDDIESDTCFLIGVRSLDPSKAVAFTSTSDSEWITDTKNTGSAAADPCCTYYTVVGNSSAWSASTNANTRHLEMMTDIPAPYKYTLSYMTMNSNMSVSRLSSSYGCVGGIASGADIYNGDVLSIDKTISCAYDEDANIINFPYTVNGDDVTINYLHEVSRGDVIFENGAPTTSKDNLTTVQYTGWGWVIPKSMVPLPVSKVSVPTMFFNETEVPVQVSCKLLDANKNLIGDKIVTEEVSNANGGHEFSLSFSKDEIPGDWFYVAIEIPDKTKRFGFSKISNDSKNPWVNFISDTTTYKPIYMYNQKTTWDIANSPNLRHIILKSNI